MPATATPLRYAVRPRVIAKHVGQLAVVLGVLVLASVIVALVYREYVEAAWYGGAAVALAVAGIVLARMKAPQDVQLNEALVVTCLIFLVATAAMIAPMMSEGLGAVDACFEAVSGVTTTGLTTLSTVEDKSRSFLFTRAWMQWYGGLGMVVFSLALFTSPGLPAKQLATTEYFQTDLVAGSRAFARRALVIYAIMTAISVGGLLAFRVHPFDAVAYSLAAVSTGGFSPYDASLNALPSRGAQGFILLMCVGGAVSFMYYIRVFEQGWRALGRSGEFVLLVVLGAVASILLMVCAAVARDVPWTHTVIDDVLTAFSAQTTTGFNTVAMKPLDEASKLVIILSMAIGGEVGSTAGGFKVMRLLIFFRLVQTLIIRTALPRHAVHKARFGGEVQIGRAHV